MFVIIYNIYMSKITITKKHSSTLRAGPGIKKDIIPTKIGSDRLRSGATLLDPGSRQSSVRTVQKERQIHRDAAKERYRGNFKSEEDFNKWADYYYNYNIINKQRLGQLAPIQGAGIGDVVKGGNFISRGIARSMPSIFRSVANYDGPISMIPALDNSQYRNRAAPEAFRNLTEAQINQYTFGPAHNSESFQEGTGTLADYIQNGGDINAPEIAPFVELFENRANSEAVNQEYESANDLVNRVMGPINRGEEVKLPPRRELPPVVPIQAEPYYPANPTNPVNPAIPVNPIPANPVNPHDILRLQPPSRGQPTRQGPNGDPLPPYRGPYRPGGPFRVRPIVPPYIPDVPTGPKGPQDQPPKKPNKPDNPDEPDEPDEPDKPDNPDNPDKTPDDHKVISGEGYGYIRPEFSTDMGLETMVLSNKETLYELNQWDKFDEVTDAIYTLDNPLYLRHLENDQFRYSGIAKDPFFYMIQEYERYNAPDDFKIYPTQGSRFSSNNLQTATGQCSRNPFIIAGPRERGLAYRSDPNYDTDLLQRIYENPDLESLIEDDISYRIPDDSLLIAAFKKSTNIADRWTTEISDYIDNL